MASSLPRSSLLPRYALVLPALAFIATGSFGAAADSQPDDPVARVARFGKDAAFVARVRENHGRLRTPRHTGAHGAADREGVSAGFTAPSVAAPISGPASQDDYDALHYGLQLTIDPWSFNRVVDGSVDLRLESLVPQLDTVILDLASNLEVSEVLRSGVGPQSFEHASDLLTITLDPPAGRHEQVDLRVAYGGTPISSGFGGFGIDWSRSHPVVWTLSEPEEARTWWPSKDRPDDKATVSVSIRMDESFVVGSNGLLTSIDDHGDGTRTHNWETRYLLPPYLVAVTATDFVRFEDSYSLQEGGTLPLVYYTYPESESRAREDVSAIPGMLSVFEDKFGPYPFADEKYGQIEFPWGGAMEHTTLTSYGTWLYTGDHYYDWIEAHELAHQWWGDLVTCGTWDDIWLNEGFATYGEAVWTEGVEGYDAYLAYMQALDSGYFEGPIYDPFDTFNSTVYDKGAWILHMLRGIVGQETLFEILAAWRDAYGHAAAVTEDFTELAAQVAGQDLDWFFDPWLYVAGRPRYEYATRITTLPGDSSLVELEITQVQSGYMPYRMPITVEIQRAGQEAVRATVVDSLESQRFEFRVAGIATHLEPDPEGYILARFWKVPWTGIGSGGDLPGSRRFSSLGLPNPNPFNPRTGFPVELARDLPRVTISIFDGRGARVRTIHDGPLSAGAHRFVWDGATDSGAPLPSGVYTLRMEPVGAPPESRSLVLLK